MQLKAGHWAEAMIIVSVVQHAAALSNVLESRHTVCRAAQEKGACANGSEYINRNNKVAILTHL